MSQGLKLRDGEDIVLVSHQEVITEDASFLKVFKIEIVSPSKTRTVYVSEDAIAKRLTAFTFVEAL